MSRSSGRRVRLATAKRRQPLPMTSLTDVIAGVIHAAATDRVTVRGVLNAIGVESFAPVLLLPALAVASPLSGLPFFSAVMGITIFLVSLQMLLHTDSLWLPGWMLRRTIKGAVVTRAFTSLLPIAGWIDARTDRRLRFLVHRPLVFIPHLLCTLSGACMPFLEFVPFSSSILGIGVALLAVAILARDGVLILIGMLPYAVVGWLIIVAIS